jgi:hypothetical protein
MLLALKAQWAVYAGVIPGKPEPEFTKAWEYTSADYESDCQLPDEPEAMSAYRRMAGEAQAYAASLQDPRGLNWVRLEWMWL